MLVNPGHPIPPTTRAIHHISDADVDGAITPDAASAKLMGGMEPGDVFAAHNAKFERAFFGGGAHRWICTLQCAKHLFPQAPGHSNQVLRYWLNIDGDGMDPVLAMPPHRAGPDTYVTAFIVSRMLMMAGVDDLVRLTSAPVVLQTITFGKHRGAKWADLPPDYLSWIANKLVPADQTSTKEIGIATGAGGASIAPQNLGEVVRFAEVMCRADIALPKHLRGNAGACMAVAMQALEWQMSPFAVASKSYEVGGRIAYEAQLIAAVVNTRSGIKGRLRYEFLGEGADLSCRVTGILDGEECEYETPPMGAITVKNSPLWKSDPRQQLGYFAARSWARRHCPEVISAHR
jgi:uncharacterized protein (DUF3820 family)